MPSIEEIIRLVNTGTADGTVSSGSTLPETDPRLLPTPTRRSRPPGRFLAIGKAAAAARRQGSGGNRVAPPAPARILAAVEGSLPAATEERRKRLDGLFEAEKAILAKLAPLLMRRGFIGQFTTPRSVAAVPAGNPLPARLPAPPATRRFRNIFLPKDVNPAPAGPEGCPGCASPNCARICYENGRLRRVGIVIFHSYARRTVRPVTGLPRAAEQGDFVGDVPLFRIYSQLSGHHDPILGSFRRLRITSEQGVLMLVRNGGFTLYEEKARRLFCYDATAAAAIVAIRTFLEATP